MKVIDRSGHTSDMAWLTYPSRLCRQYNVERTPAVRFGLAIGCTLSSISLAIVAAPFSNVVVLFILLLAVTVSAWLGGLRPAIASMAICTAALLVGILPGTPANTWTSVGYLVELGTFLVAATLLSIRLEHAENALLQSQIQSEINLRQADEIDFLRIREAESREEVDSVRKRLTWLASTSNLLVASLDDRLILERLARITVDHLADWCVIDLIGASGGIDRMAAAAKNPANQKLADELLGYTPEVPSLHPVARVLMSGQSEVIQRSDERSISNFTQNARHAQLVNELGAEAVAHIPMMARGRTLGVLTMAVADQAARFDAADVALAQDLAHRAALGIDNARLYREAQDEIAERKRVETILVQHKEEIESLNFRLQRAMTETHHRVKNNLQVIAAMVDMQLMRDEEVIRISEMARLGTHIRTLASVHEILTHQTKSDANAELVSVSEVLGKLMPMLSQTAGTHIVEFHVEDLLLPARQATSLALVANELVSNAIKHGTSRVDVSFTVHAAEARLTVSDDGAGFPDGFDPLKAANTGLELVENLSRWDLAGDSRYTTGAAGGAMVTIVMPLRDPLSGRAPETAEFRIAEPCA